MKQESRILRLPTRGKKAKGGGSVWFLLCPRLFAQNPDPGPPLATCGIESKAERHSEANFPVALRLCIPASSFLQRARFRFPESDIYFLQVRKQSPIYL